MRTWKQPRTEVRGIDLRPGRALRNSSARPVPRVQGATPQRMENGGRESFPKGKDDVGRKSDESGATSPYLRRRRRRY
jgi:hypothetical protein